jgi:hypothetical protein
MNIFLWYYKKVLVASVCGNTELEAVFAELAAASTAKKTLAATNYRIDSDAITHFRFFNAAANLYHDTCDFMAKNNWRSSNPQPPFHNVNVCSADSNRCSADQNLIKAEQLWDRGLNKSEISSAFPNKPLQMRHPLLIKNSEIQSQSSSLEILYKIYTK